jgi:hypothetical protein
MIGVKLEGRLGNQMFQYAFALACSKNSESDYFIISDKTAPFILPTFFTLQNYNPFLNFLRRKRFIKKLQVVTFENELLPEDNLKKLKPDSIFHGYFQSEEYFKKISSFIKEEFEIKKKYKEAFEKKFYDVFNNNKVIAVHVRKEDYKIFGNETLGGKDLSLPLEYYLKSLNQIKDVDSYKVIFVSDDPDELKKNFPKKDNYFFESNFLMTDFQILMSADILILANSSFSWWAAYLNKKVEKVFYPDFWLGFRVNKFFPAGIPCKNWDPIRVF